MEQDGLDRQVGDNRFHLPTNKIPTTTKPTKEDLSRIAVPLPLLRQKLYPTTDKPSLKSRLALPPMPPSLASLASQQEIGRAHV